MLSHPLTSLLFALIQTDGSFLPNSAKRPSPRRSLRPQYLEHGCQLTKIPSKGVARKRYYYIGEDRKKLCCCELDEIQTVMNKRKPATICMPGLWGFL